MVLRRDWRPLHHSGVISGTRDLQVCNVTLHDNSGRELTNEALGWRN